MAAIDFSGTFDLSQLTAAYLRDNYLLGIDVLDDAGNPYPESWWNGHLQRAARTIDRVCKLKLPQTSLLDEKHDYYWNDYQNYVYLKLFYGPVVSVDRVQIIYPTQQQGTTIPTSWVVLDKDNNGFQLVPTAGTLSQVIIGQGGSFLPLVVNGLSYLPGLFHIDYTVGYAPGQSVPLEIIEAVCKLATIEALTIAADVIYPPGMTSKSVSMDGLSESISIIQGGKKAPVFTGRIQQYTNDLWGDPALPGRTGLLREIRETFHGINFQTA